MAANNGKDDSHNRAESLIRRGLLQSCRIGKYNLYNLQQVQDYRPGKPGRHKLSDALVSSNALRQRKFKARRRAALQAQALDFVPEVQIQARMDPSQFYQGTLF